MEIHDDTEKNASKKSFFEKITGFFTDTVKEYMAEKYEEKKAELSAKFERKILKKVRREIRKTIFNVFLYTFLAIGILFITFGLISLLVTYLNLPSYYNSIFFGSLLVLIGLIIAIFK